jgi:peptidoglycan/xylan/chitin deacetylase (PgdA/CDA1 family)
MWAVDPEDWKRPGSDVVARRIISETDPGEIVLAHDIHGPTIAAMPRALDGLLANGYRFVTVSQLIAIERRSIATRFGDDDNLLSSSIHLNGQKQVR